MPQVKLVRLQDIITEQLLLESHTTAASVDTVYKPHSSRMYHKNGANVDLHSPLNRLSKLVTMVLH